MTQKIADLLPEGRENAVPAKELAKIAGFSGVRGLQRAIAREREHVVILSTCGLGGGYFRPASDEEIMQFIRTLEARSRNTAVALQSAKAALKEHQKNRLE